MESIEAFLNTPVFEFMSREFTVGMLILIPVMLLLAI